MEPNEIDLIERISPDHDELRRLLVLHHGYERDLTRLESVRFPSEAERREIQRLKRIKLRGKDRIRRILSSHGSA